MDELILRTMVIQFDGRVVEFFRPVTGEAMRYHVALIQPPEVSGRDRKERTRVSIGGYSFSVGADEWKRLAPLLDRISAAVLEAQPGTA
ncbi:MAG TPA: hypothetical protein VHU92_25690 [Streptosporangiaceae bacterium]|nr:hypothetical protein [Streptosporangiaceae bacterium]